VLTPAERRGATLVALLLALGAADELWRATHPRFAPAPAGLGGAPRTPAVPSSSIEPGATQPPLAAGDTAILSAEDPAGPVSLVSRRSASAVEFVVDLNRADAAELDRLPGIGPVLARRIIDYRTRHGRFSRCEELLAVPGIGPRLLERVRPHVAP
jgi:competence protein ComEA